MPVAKCLTGGFLYIIYLDIIQLLFYDSIKSGSTSVGIFVSLLNKNLILMYVAIIQITVKIHRWIKLWIRSINGAFICVIAINALRNGNAGTRYAAFCRANGID